MAAGDSVIGALRVVLGLDSASLEDGLKKSSSALGDFGKAVGTIASGVLLARFVEDATAALRRLVIGAIEAADEMGKMAQKTGVPIEQLSGLKFAAELADVGFSELGKGLEKLSKNLLEGATNPAGDAARAFKSLGIDVRDSSGNIKGAGDVFTDIAGKFAGMEDGSTKTALAIKLFGKAGADLIPLLNAGSSGIKAMQEEAKKLGIVISTETAMRAEEFNDTLKRVSKAADAFGLSVAAEILPGLQRMADGFLAVSQSGSNFGAILGRFLGDELVKLTREAEVFAFQLGIIGQAFALLKSISPQTTFGELKKVFGEIIDLYPQMIAGANGIRAGFANLGEAGAFDSLERLPSMLDKVGRGATKVNEDVLKTNDAIKNYITQTEKAVKTAEAHIDAIGQTSGEFEKSKVMIGLETVEKEKNIKATQDQRNQIIGLADNLARTTQVLEGTKLITDANTTSGDKYQKQVQSMQAAVDAGTKSQDEMNAALGRTKFPNLTKWIDDAKNLTLQLDQFTVKSLNALTDAFTGIATGSEKAGDAWKKLGDVIVETLIRIAAQIVIANAVALAAKALGTIIGGIIGAVFGGPLGAAVGGAGGGIFGSFIAGLFGSKGLSVVAAQSGTSLTVPGGQSAIDTTLVPLFVSPGERIDVTPGPKSTSAGGTLTINPIKPKDLFSGDMVREMVFSIDRWMKDGGTGVRFATIK